MSLLEQIKALDAAESDQNWTEYRRLILQETHTAEDAKRIRQLATLLDFPTSKIEEHLAVVARWRELQPEADKEAQVKEAMIQARAKLGPAREQRKAAEKAAEVAFNKVMHEIGMTEEAWRRSSGALEELEQLARQWQFLLCGTASPHSAEGRESLQRDLRNLNEALGADVGEREARDLEGVVADRRDRDTIRMQLANAS